MSKTKIIATVGPVSQEETVLEDLIVSGLDVIRINLSYSNHDFCEEIIKKVNKLNKELNKNVSIMFDLEGPLVRCHKIQNNEAFLKKDDKIRIYMNEVLGDSTKFSVNYPKLINDVKIGTILKINDGRVILEVLEIGGDYLLCKVVTEGKIVSNKIVNVVDTVLNRPFLSQKDKEDIIFANKMNIDFLALSYVRNVDDVLEVNDLLIELGNDHLGIISKIENESAITDIDNIITSSDGIMISRGDLSVEIPMEKVPSVQKNIIRKCHVMGKASIVATELISSMENNARPTRAEVSDLANAVLDGTDAIMLSGETTIGKYPVETLQVTEKIIGQAEEDINYLEMLEIAMKTEKQDTTGTIAYSVTESANRLKCKAIIAPTISGYTARKMSRFRPTCPIIAVSPNEETVKSLTIYFGVEAVLIDELNTLDKIIDKARNIVKSRIDIEPQDRIIITGGYPFKEVKHTNFMKIEEL